MRVLAEGKAVTVRGGRLKVGAEVRAMSGQAAGRAGVRVFGAGEGGTHAYVRIIYNIAKFV